MVGGFALEKMVVLPEHVGGFDFALDLVLDDGSFDVLDHLFVVGRVFDESTQSVELLVL